jgi:peptidoglycan-N-acetylglucosamine deacetylase
MLNFRTAKIFLVIFAVAAILLMIINLHYSWMLLILAVLNIYLFVQGSVNIRLGFYTEVFCKGNTKEKVVALTFDDGPDGNHTPAILDILDKQDIKATFFVIGHKINGQEELLRQMTSFGHIIGNHSFSHAFLFDLFGRKKMEQDLLKTDEMIMGVTGIRPVLFRPPYGVTNPVLAKVVKKLGYRVIGWSVRSLDTVKKDEDKIVERIKKGLHPGAVILMHDDREMAVKVIERVILMVKEEGYRFVGLDELLAIEF